MNKEEFIKQLENERGSARIKDSKLSTYLSDDYYTGKTYAYKRAIQLAERLDEPTHEPMEVPDYVAELIRKYKAKKETLVCSIANLYRESDEYKWYVDNAEIYERAWANGYTVKPKQWAVKMKNAFFADFAKSCLGNERKKEWDLADFNTIVKGEVAKAYKFTDKAKAEAVATLVGGKVEEI